MEGCRTSLLDRTFPVALRGGSDTEPSGDFRRGGALVEVIESLERSFLQRGGVVML